MKQLILLTFLVALLVLEARHNDLEKPSTEVSSLTSFTQFVQTWTE